MLFNRMSSSQTIIDDLKLLPRKKSKIEHQEEEEEESGW